jgi:hypothetical protein
VPSRSGAWLVDDTGFRHLVDMEIHKAQRLRYCVSLLYMAADRRSPEESEPSAPSLAGKITPLLRLTDAVTCVASSILALMLVDADVANLPSIGDRITTRLDMVRWSAGGACYPKTVTHAEELFGQAPHLMRQAQSDGGDRLYLPT